MNNAYRHAGSVDVSVSAQMNQSNLNIHISDSGSGFEVDKTHPSSSSGLGLLGLRDRIESLGGEFKIESKLGQGTRISATLPVNEEIYVRK